MSDEGTGGTRDPDRAPFWERKEWWVQTGVVSAALLAASLLGFLTSVLAARGLGPASYGAVVLAVSTAFTVAVFLDFPLEEAVVHHGARSVAAGDLPSVRALIRTSLVMDVAVGVVVFTGLFAFASPIASAVSHGRLEPVFIQLAALQVLVTTANGASGAVLLLAARPDVRSWAMTWSAAARLSAVAVAATWGAKAVLWAYVIGSGAGAVVLGLLAWRQARRLWGVAPVPPRTPVPLRRLASFGIQTSLMTSLVAVKVAVVSVLLGRLGGSADVGVFNVAMLPVTLAGIASAPIRLTMFPEQAKLAADGRSRTLWQSMKWYTLTALGVGIPGAALGWFLLPLLLTSLYGDRFAAAVEPARILLVAALAILAVGWSKPLAAAVGRPQVRTVVALGELAFTIPLMIALAGHGPTGAAMAVSITSVASAIAWWALARRMLARVTLEPAGAGSGR